MSHIELYRTRIYHERFIVMPTISIFREHREIYVATWVVLLVGCASNGTTRTTQNGFTQEIYAAEYEAVLEAIAQTAREVGLDIDEATAESESRYIINCSKRDSGAGISDEVAGRGIQVAALHIVVEKLNDENVIRVSIRHETAGNTRLGGGMSGGLANYPDRIFDRLDEQFPHTETTPATM